MTAPIGATTVDLQVHSTASDGAAAPETIPAIAASAGLSAFALTDHDSTEGVVAAQRAAEALNIRVIAGVELSAFSGEKEVHLLGLHLQSLDALEVRLARFRADRGDRGVAIVAKLQALGIPISFADVEKQAAGAALGRPHIARVLVAMGVVADFREAFDRYLGAGRSAFMAKPVLSVRDAIAIVHEAGGLAIWAHPGRDGRRDALEQLMAYGLDGTEVLHPGHSPDDVQRLNTLCDYLGLVPSGGSDWHGETTGYRTLGVMKVPGEWLAMQDARVVTRRAAGT